MDNYGLRAQTAPGLVVSHVLIEAGALPMGRVGRWARGRQWRARGRRRPRHLGPARQQTCRGDVNGADRR